MFDSRITKVGLHKLSIEHTNRQSENNNNSNVEVMCVCVCEREKVGE